MSAECQLVFKTPAQVPIYRLVGLPFHGGDDALSPQTSRTREGGTNVGTTQKVIKWRTAAPIAKAAVSAGTVVALIAVVGAPWKWW